MIERQATIYPRRHWKRHEVTIIMTLPANQKGAKSLTDYIERVYLPEYLYRATSPYWSAWMTGH